MDKYVHTIEAMIKHYKVLRGGAYDALKFDDGAYYDGCVNALGSALGMYQDEKYLDDLYSRFCTQERS